MCRGDRCEPIFEDDEDRGIFLRTLRECCEKSGWRIYAWVLMSNHYHWVLQTPEANLVAGMKWFQNTYTRRLNTRHAKWGHVFGGRYKAVLVESSGGGYLETLMDYVHLNPVRAGLVDVQKGKGLLDFRWSSLAQGYGVSPRQRPFWLATVEGLELFGYKDEARDRRRFVERLEKRALEDKGRVAGPHEGLQNTLHRGWYWGSQEFREKMLKLVNRTSSNRNYQSSILGRQKDRREAEFWLEKTRAHYGLGSKPLTDAPRPARLAAAWALHHRTHQPQSWIADQLGLHTAANVSQQVRRIDSPNPPDWSQNPAWKQWVSFVENC
jgi:REP element-mobilizing transposase RayT